MSHAEFVHLRVHTAYSLSEGAARIKDLSELCRGNRMPAVAITDTSNLFGGMEFSTTLAKAGVQPIIGCQLRLSRESQAGSFAQSRTAATAPIPMGPDKFFDGKVYDPEDVVGYLKSFDIHAMKVSADALAGAQS